MAATEGVTPDEVAAVTAGAGAATAHGALNPTTNRIVVPTGENNPPRATGNTDYDEATVVRAPVIEELEHAPVFVEAAPPPASGFNPWSIAIPAIVVLLAVFGVFYAMRGSQTASEQQTPPLTSDPHSQPVQTVTPPTGAGEKNITPIAGTPTPNAGAGTGTVGGLPLTTAPDITTPTSTTSPTPQGNSKHNTGNSNDNEPAEDAPAKEIPQATATPAEKPPQKRSPTPPPPTDADTNVKPEPAPTPKRRTAPTPPPAATDATPELAKPSQSPL